MYDLNAKIGNGTVDGVTGTYSLGVRNELSEIFFKFYFHEN